MNLTGLRLDRQGSTEVRIDVKITVLIIYVLLTVGWPSGVGLEVCCGRPSCEGS